MARGADVSGTRRDAAAFARRAVLAVVALACTVASLGIVTDCSTSESGTAIRVALALFASGAGSIALLAHIPVPGRRGAVIGVLVALAASALYGFLWFHALDVWLHPVCDD